jgi:hypothetical protein
MSSLFSMSRLRGRRSPAATDLLPTRVPEDDEPHVCKPGSTVYFCPTSGETESDCHGGFDVCCSAPELHRPLEQRIAELTEQRETTIRLARFIQRHGTAVEAGLAQRFLLRLGVPVAEAGVPAAEAAAMAGELARYEKAMQDSRLAMARVSSTPNVPDTDESLRAALAQAEADLAAFHRGEDPYEPGQQVLTPGEFIAAWNQATPERRQEVARGLLADGEDARRCWRSDHQGRLQDMVGLHERVRAAEEEAQVLRRRLRELSAGQGTATSSEETS